ncbi:hypothetical protein HCN44_001528 [Aphidius gifuensis]|uniref:Uncharacterized protein n=1 Tax=Aphidius gifuensis TaxID=684658 RepID=A0A834XRP1_APHGI|nr:uncharacterized protein LOC122853297 [Aphidius gifuensis]KAF7992203.1 hypothetical protein HCN44_001528 [Aphidius gifuensis]
MNVLKFCSNPCQCHDTSLNLSKLSELKQRAFGKNNNYEDPFIVNKQRYNKKVLLGNWYEERADNTRPADKCKSNYNDAKTNEKDEPIKDDEENYDTFQTALMHKKKQQGIGRDLIAAPGDYDNNFSTLYDLTYRVLPKGLKGPRLRVYNATREAYLPEIDLTENFGNLYGYGLKEYIKEKARIIDQSELDQENKDSMRTSYQCEYTKKKIPDDIKRFPLKSAEMNTPDLRYLGIDLNARWSRLYTHGFHRPNFLPKPTCG